MLINWSQECGQNAKLTEWENSGMCRTSHFVRKLSSLLKYLTLDCLLHIVCPVWIVCMKVHNAYIEPFLKLLMALYQKLSNLVHRSTELLNVRIVHCTVHQAVITLYLSTIKLLQFAAVHMWKWAPVQMCSFANVPGERGENQLRSLWTSFAIVHSALGHNHPLTWPL